MREGYHNSIVEHNSKVVGINLGADACTEHECGIGDLRKKFEMDANALGIEKRRVRTVPTDDILYIDDKDGTVLIVISSYTIESMLEDVVRKDFTFKRMAKTLGHYFHLSCEGENLVSAWDEYSFGVACSSKNPAYQQVIREVYAALQKKDLAIMQGSGNCFIAGGLNLLIISRLPETFTKELHDKDMDCQNLLEAAKKTGIEERLRKADKHWFSLSPRWAKDFKFGVGGNRPATKYAVVFWLNPMEQDKYNANWMRVEDLEDWLENKGAVIRGAQNE